MSNENFLPNTEFNLVKTTPEGYTEFYVKLPYTTSRVVGYVRSHGHATLLSIMNSRIGNFDVTPTGLRSLLHVKAQCLHTDSSMRSACAPSPEGSIRLARMPQFTPEGRIRAGGMRPTCLLHAYYMRPISLLFRMTNDAPNDE